MTRKRVETGDRGLSLILREHYDAVVEHVPRPGRVWHWDACELPQTLKEHLRRQSLIERDPRVGGWETSEVLWTIVIDMAGTAGDGEDPPGVALGQERLLAPGDIDATEDECRHSPRGRVTDVSDCTQQVDLSGDIVDDDGRMSINDVRERTEAVRQPAPTPGEDPGQMTLQMAVGQWSEAVMGGGSLRQRGGLVFGSLR
jgi:hypothetical protein